MTTPLDDIRIIEIDSYMAAPSAGGILADLGADVIKIEPLSGDPMRGLSRPAKVDGPFAEYDLQFDVDNRGKRSIALALDVEAGADVARHLIAGANVFLCNLLAHRQKKFRMDPASLLAINPKLVHATLTGYGTIGPEARRPGYDVTAFFGRSGLYDAMREGDHGVVPMARPGQGDHTAGLALVGTILAGLRLAERTGQGQIVETSLLESAVWTQASDYSITVVDKAPVRRRDRHHQLTPVANRYPCGDGHWIVLNSLDARAWERFCRAIERPEWLDDERYGDPRSRYRNMAELVDAIDHALSVRSRDEWGTLFDEAGIIWGPVLGLDELVQDPHAEAIGLFPELEHPEHGRYRTVRAPMKFHSAEVGPRAPAPALDQHGRQILAEAGYSEGEVGRLIELGAVRGTHT